MLIVALIASVFIISCGGSEPDAADAESVELTVAAASDLQVAFTEVGALFEDQTGHSVTFSFGSSGNLATQIENGAPFDVYAAANVDFVDGLVEQGFVDGETQRLYGIGHIVLASSVASGMTVEDLSGLLDPDIRHVAIANPEHAPYGMAAREALINAGIWDEIQPKLVYGENIRQTLQFVQTGNAEVGIVALSIADVPEITWTMIDESLHEPLLQSIGVVSDTPNADVAVQFVHFVTGPEGREILATYGFSPPDQQ